MGMAEKINAAHDAAVTDAVKKAVEAMARALCGVNPSDRRPCIDHPSDFMCPICTYAIRASGVSEKGPGVIDEISKIYLLRLRELVEKGEFPRHIEDVISRLFAALEKEKARSAELQERLSAQEAKASEMRAALGYACRFCHGGYIDCNGDKCRQKNCTACYGDDAVGFDSGIIEKAIVSDGGTLSAELKLLREFEGIYRNSPLDGDENVITFIRLVIPVIKKLDALRDWNSKQDSGNGEKNG